MGFRVVSMPTPPDSAKIWELKRIENKIGSDAMLLIYAAVQPHSKRKKIVFLALEQVVFEVLCLPVQYIIITTKPVFVNPV